MAQNGLVILETSLTFNYIGSLVIVTCARNELAEKEAMKAVQELCSKANSLPPFLHKNLSVSISALKQQHNQLLANKWRRTWKKSLRYLVYYAIEKFTPSKPS